MGLIEPDEEITPNRVTDALRAFVSHGIGTHNMLLGADTRSGVDALLVEVEDCPVPSSEWESVGTVFDVAELASLVGTSSSSVRRYSSGERSTPDDVAMRLHTLAMAIADLAGSYNRYGVRRWFSRPRAQLGGKAPKDIYSGHWDPDSESAIAVRDLAEGLLVPHAS